MHVLTLSQAGYDPGSRFFDRQIMLLAGLGVSLPDLDTDKDVI